MLKLILSIITLGFLFITNTQCQTWNETDTSDNATMNVPPKPFVYYGRYHQRARLRREYSDENITSEHETIETILSILPLDRIGAVIGQLIATSFKEMLHPNAGKKILHVLENQAPSLLTSLFNNIYGTLRVPIRSSTNNLTIKINQNINKPLSNSSKLVLFKAMKRRGTK
ncbi:hypothetical protein I4U23_017706 [Adineta vaga]|nr:hypothetical protein I4U23_017706 [Adineta vaga]